jgi:acyl carrier protein
VPVSEVSDKIRGFIKDELLFETPGMELTDDTLLLEGIIDSLGLMQLVAYLEEEFGTEIGDADITADHFRTISDIEKLVTANATHAES